MFRGALTVKVQGPQGSNSKQNGIPVLTRPPYEARAVVHKVRVMGIKAHDESWQDSRAAAGPGPWYRGCNSVRVFRLNKTNKKILEVF